MTINAFQVGGSKGTKALLVQQWKQAVSSKGKELTLKNAAIMVLVLSAWGSMPFSRWGARILGINEEGEDNRAVPFPQAIMGIALMLPAGVCTILLGFLICPPLMGDNPEILTD